MIAHPAKHWSILVCLVLLFLGPVHWASGETGLVAHWKLTGDCQDSSGRGNHGVDHGVQFSGDGATFDGIASDIEVPDSESLGLATGDWSIAVWLHTEADLDDVLGDVLSKYDPVSRTGINLGLIDSVGATSAQSNRRNLWVGIDAGRVAPAWTDCGRPGKSQFIKALAVYDGHLYAGTWEPGEGEAGHVYRYEGGTDWTDCGSPDISNTVSSLAEYQGRLYAGVSFYSGRGSALPESPNKNPGGKVYRYEGGTQWTDCGKIGDVYTVYGLVDFRGQLYATTCDSYGCPKPMQAVFRYDGGQKWTFCGDPGGRTGAFAIQNGDLYATVYGKEGFARYDGGTKWTPLGIVPDATQVYSTVIYQGHICLGTWPHALVVRYDEPGKYTSLGRLGNEQETMAMAVYNGKLYGGTLPGQVDATPDVKYRRVWSMAVYRGKLFAGTLPSGRVLSLEAGKCASYDRALPPGWRHVAAVKTGESLRLYVDGQRVAESTAFDPAEYNLSNHEPLRIGTGENDRFHGKMKDLRIYDRALGEEEIRALGKQ
jgi:hypothetical protein